MEPISIQFNALNLLKNMSFFSIIIPSYNRAHIVLRAVNSVLNQSFQDFEIIVVDDGSTDDSKNTISAITDSRVKYIYQTNKGVCAARNHGASIAKGDFFVFLDSDDYVANNWLEDFHNAALKDTPDLVFCDMRLIDIVKKTERIITATDPHEKGEVSQEGMYLAGTFCIRNSFFKNTGGFDEKIKFGEFTEFGFSCKIKNPVNSFTGKLGLIYEASLEGGSKNIKNKIEANLYIIEKHNYYFNANPHVLRFYYQNIGVAYARLKEWRAARPFFWKAYLIDPLKIKTLIRFLVCLYPSLACKIIK